MHFEQLDRLKIGAHLLMLSRTNFTVETSAGGALSIRYALVR